MAIQSYYFKNQKMRFSIPQVMRFSMNKQSCVRRNCKTTFTLNKMYSNNKKTTLN